ncbi:haloacid dehalogenase-like hydrolase [Pseudomonas tructae]|uniref:phosphoserine phosphatase n=1 Tax=Pseudomonas tructae TaxID=2518644 RepID=A0A411MIS0_9PSED|nr:HAD family hydrolase [Pseudomonas tructae]QBF26722.1 haloacid dehalogenase-like hydrolase [Pseudomonas tructae]
MGQRLVPSSVLRSMLYLLLLIPVLAQAADALPSWRDGPSRQAIEAFVSAVTGEGSPNYRKPAERIAVFDNDGTLWSEQPLYFELLFSMAEVKRLAPEHPEWKTQQPFQAVLEDDHKALAEQGMDGMLKIVAATHSGMSTEDFLARSRSWLASARHPKTGRPYTEMVFQPMLELLDYLRSNGFRTYIVSGGEVAFMRAFAEEVYGIPPEQVIGTTLAAEYKDSDGKPIIERLAKLAHNDDGPGKPVSIEAVIGRRPLLAFGNSDGDLQMLQWTMAGEGRRFAALVHHTDGQREWAYDRNSNVGRLDKALDAAGQQGWAVVDMAKEWRRVYPFDKE